MKEIDDANGGALEGFSFIPVAFATISYLARLSL
jgi:hypothetical protein